MSVTSLASKYPSAFVVASQQTGFRGFLPWGRSGVCNTVVLDWFRRIDAGRTTWLAAKDKATGRTVVRDAVPWRRKVDRWMHLQDTGAYADDARFGGRNRPFMLEMGGADGRDQLLVRRCGGALSGADCKAVVRAVAGYDPDPGEGASDVFFLLGLFGRNAGHSIGLHRNVRASTKEDGFVVVEDRRLVVAPSDLHVYDPNQGEFVVEAGRWAEFVGDMVNGRYPGFALSCAVVRIPIWWRA